MVRLKLLSHFYLISSYLHFNSTMVRLKLSLQPGKWRLRKYFNSTMVRLKQRRKRRQRFRSLQFQFHYGSIKTFVIWYISPNKFISIPLWFDWNWQGLSKKTARLHFNSTMVRLKQNHLVLVVVCIQFQFHYGSIKTIWNMVKCPISQFISIPLWFD